MKLLHDELRADRAATVSAVAAKELTGFWGEQTLFAAAEVPQKDVRVMNIRFADQPLSSVRKAFSEWWNHNKFFPHFSDVEKRIRFFTWQLDRAIDRANQLIEYDQENDPSTKI